MFKVKKGLEETLRKRTAELESLRGELAQFTHAVSHDLRTPLRAVEGFGEALEEEYGGRLDQTGRDYLSRIREATSRMQKMIDGLMRISRASEGELRRDPVALSEMAEEILGKLRRSEPHRQVAVSIEPALKIEGDSRLLSIALEQLLDNAWKFTRKAAVTKISLKSERRGGMRILHLRDNGVGFDGAYAERLFGAFQRLHSAAEFEGLGIGLALTQRIIHRHGWRIGAEGRVNEGAVIRIEIDE